VPRTLVWWSTLQRREELLGLVGVDEGGSISLLILLGERLSCVTSLEEALLHHIRHGANRHLLVVGPLAPLFSTGNDILKITWGSSTLWACGLLHLTYPFSRLSLNVHCLHPSWRKFPWKMPVSLHSPITLKGSVGSETREFLRTPLFRCSMLLVTSWWHLSGRWVVIDMVSKCVVCFMQRDSERSLGVGLPSSLKSSTCVLMFRR